MVRQPLLVQGSAIRIWGGVNSHVPDKKEAKNKAPVRT